MRHWYNCIAFSNLYRTLFHQDPGLSVGLVAWLFACDVINWCRKHYGLYKHIDDSVLTCSLYIIFNKTDSLPNRHVFSDCMSSALSAEHSVTCRPASFTYTVWGELVVISRPKWYRSIYAYTCITAHRYFNAFTHTCNRVDRRADWLDLPAWWRGDRSTSWTQRLEELDLADCQ